MRSLVTGLSAAQLEKYLLFSSGHFRISKPPNREFYLSCPSLGFHKTQGTMANM